jgi:ABC-type uncharacterized transport system substrate-binding protein
VKTAFGEAAVALAILAAPGAADLDAALLPRVGLLATGRCEANRNYDAFRRGLRELGYVEGRDITIDCRDAGSRPDRLPGAAAELLRLKPDVLVTDNSASTQAAMRATKTIPIVMGTVGDPVGSRFVASLARPGGNVTGLTLLSTELNAKRLELIRELVPGNPRVLVLVNPDNPITPLQVRELGEAAKPLGVALRVVEARDPAGVDQAFATVAGERLGALLVLPDSILSGQRARIVALAARARLPGVYEAREFVEAGGLMAYGPRIADNFHRAATLVDKILKGSRPDQIPVEQPTTFELIVSLRTASALGLTIPQSILLRADEVIQ